MIKGNLSSFSLGEIFQSLAVNNHTGTLKIVEKGGSEKYVYFSQGEICLFTESSHTSLRMGEILVRQGAITREQLSQALSIQEGSNEKIGQILVKKMGVNPDAIQEAMVTKIYDEIYDLFLLSEAEFEFFIDHFPEEVFEAFPDNLRISINTYSVVMEGLRVADEWKVIGKKIQTFNEIFALEPSAFEKQLESAQDAALVDLVDGASPVRRLFDQFPGNRFECCKTLFGLIGAGLVRTLTIDECREKGNQARKQGDLEAAFDFLQYAVELSPDRAESLVLLGSLLEKMSRETEGREYLRRAAMILSTEESHASALQVAEPLLKLFHKDFEFVAAVYTSALATKKLQIIETAGEALSAAWLAKGKKQEAATVLLEICELIPRDVERKTRAARLLRECGSIKESVAVLESVAGSLSGRAKIGEKIRVLRSIYELAPERLEIKEEITRLLDQQQRLESRKKRSFTIVGALVIALLVLLFVPVLYEIKAREQISHAQRLEEISHASGDYSVPRQAYESVITTYGFSSRVRHAREGIDRIQHLERVLAEARELEAQRTEKKPEDRLAKTKETIGRLFELAEEMEQRGDYQSAFDVMRKISTDFPEVPQTRQIRLPVTISTSPSGGVIKVNGKEAGTSPLVVREKNGEALSLEISRSGCQTLQASFTVGTEWRVHYDLKVRPLDMFSVSGAIHAPINAYEGDLYFPSRDAHFYAVYPKDKSVLWRRKIGEFGDLVSPPIYTSSEMIFGNVIGEILAISRSNGHARWRTPLKTTVLARPTLSPDSAWIAVGDLNGNVFMLDSRSGKPAGAYSTENEILRAPVFWGERLVVASEDNSLYVLSVPTAKRTHVESFNVDINSELGSDRELVFFGTSDGSLHCFNILKSELVWTVELGDHVSNTPIVAEGLLIVGTARGRVVCLDPASGEIASDSAVASAAVGEALVIGERAFFGSQAGEIIEFAFRIPKVNWVYRFEDSIQQAPVELGGRLYFASANGTFAVMELFE